MGTLELVARGRDSRMPDSSEAGELGGAMLLYNARWFMKVRLLVGGVFIIAGLIGILFRATLEELGFPVPFEWLWALAVGLFMANLVFVLWVRRFPPEPPRTAVKAHLWLQIAADLVIVTLLVHVIGSTQTFIAFIYLFHITLACIFFPKRESFLVTLSAAILYLVVVVLEIAGVWPREGMLAVTAAPVPRNPSFSMLTAGSAVFIWFVVWYLASTLSTVVRKRDLQLSAANEQLKSVGREKNRQMLMTAHELKVPFAGIESNIEALKVQYWVEIPEPVRAILERIDHRAQLLSERINQILFLGNLKSRDPSEDTLVSVDLEQVFDAVQESLEQKARERRIRLEVGVPKTVVPGNAEQLTVLFTNLVSNAILYSNEGESVEISAREDADEVSVLVTDHGIGIREEALPHIFEEFYRTKEGARFNKMSTGLGLAIVKEIARQYGLRIKVSSEETKGTTFEVGIPRENARA